MWQMSNSSSERLGALFTTSQGVRDSATDPSPGPLDLTGVLFSQPLLPFRGGAALVHGYQDAPFLENQGDRTEELLLDSHTDRKMGPSSSFLSDMEELQFVRNEFSLPVKG